MENETQPSATHPSGSAKFAMPKLSWRKSGAKVWIGTVGHMTYTVEERPFHATGGTRWHVTRGGIASSERFGSAPTAAGAKSLAQQDATHRDTGAA